MWTCDDPNWRPEPADNGSQPHVINERHRRTRAIPATVLSGRCTGDVYSLVGLATRAVRSPRHAHCGAAISKKRFRTPFRGRSRATVDGTSERVVLDYSRSSVLGPPPRTRRLPKEFETSPPTPPLPAAPLSFSGPRSRRLEKAGYIDGPSFKQRRGTPHHDGTHSRNVVRTVPSQAQSAAAAVRTAVLGSWLPPHHAAAPSPNAFVVLAYSSNSF